MRKLKEQKIMQKQLNKFAGGLLILLTMSACTTTPTQEAGKSTAVKMPSAAKTAYDRALWSAKADRFDEAIDLFSKMTRDYPAVGIAYTNLGLLYLKKGRLEESEQALQKALELNPSDAIAYNHLGVVYRELGRFEEAHKAYTSALKINPDYANAHLNLGILSDIYFQNFKQALDHYQKYQTLSEGNDKQVANWIVDIERRLAAQNRSRGKQG